MTDAALYLAISFFMNSQNSVVLIWFTIICYPIHLYLYLSGLNCTDGESDMKNSLTEQCCF